MALGPVQPHVRAAADVVKRAWGITNIGGYATSGHITNSDHYKGLAIDVMTSNVPTGNKVANWAIGHSQVTYVIWQRKIYDRRNGQGWQPYSGSSPHTDHVHISFRPETSKEAEIRKTGQLWSVQIERARKAGASIANPAGAIGDAAADLLGIGNLIEWLKESSLRVVMFVGGGLFIIVGLAFYLFKSPAGKSIQQTAKAVAK